MPGKFITFEGGEGVGKSTQVAALARFLVARGVVVKETREPGGSPFADRLRDALLAPDEAPRSALAEALAFYAARADHIAHTIRPALSSGAMVISDRYSDSTRAYQGAAGGVPVATLDTLEALVTRDARPDLTILLDLDPSAGLARARRRGQSAAQETDAFEARQLAFHQRLRAGFLALATAEPQRIAIVDASLAPDAVSAAVRMIVSQRLRLG